MILTHRIRHRVTLCACLLLTLECSAQAHVSPLPNDPIQLLETAHSKNGLTGVATPPWHIRASYQAYGGDGKITDQGIYEEWWFSQTRFRRVFTGKDFSQTDYANGSELFRQGAQEWKGEEVLLRQSLLDPVPSPESLKEFDLQKKSLAISNAQFACVALSYRMAPARGLPVDFYPEYCFDSDLPVLRLWSWGHNSRMVFDRPGIFLGQYISRQLSFFIAGKLRYSIKLNTAETIPASSVSITTAPSDAHPIDLSLITLFPTRGVLFFPTPLKAGSVSGSEGARLELSKGVMISGVVVVRATIGEDGTVRKTDVVSGPFALRQAASDAIRQVVFRPITVFGKPRDTVVQLAIQFRPPVFP